VIDSLYAETLFNHLYGNINGYSVSNAARAKFSHDTEKLLYGEMPFVTWAEIVDHVKPKKDGVFFDLGSGTGRVVVESHLLFDFKKCTGVELLEGLHNKACEVKQQFEKVIKPQIENHLSGRELTFLNNDIFTTDLHEADLVLMNHPFKDGEVFMQLEEKFLKELKSGTKIVTIIRALKSEGFKNMGSQTYKFSWGDSTAHFFEVR
jgi:precorrin-6B methylase 2